VLPMVWMFITSIKTQTGAPNHDPSTG